MFAQKSKKPISVNDLLGTVDAMRDQIAALRDERAQVENAPRPLDETLGLLDAHLDALATSAVDNLSLHHLRDRRGTFGLKLSQSGISDFAIQTLFGLFVATSRDALRSVIVGQLEDLAQARPGMSDQDRQERLAEIDRAILKAELAEEAAIRALERQGVSIARRADLSPLIALAADDALAG